MGVPESLLFEQDNISSEQKQVVKIERIRVVMGQK
jgi:hypothetical protein